MAISAALMAQPSGLKTSYTLSLRANWYASHKLRAHRFGLCGRAQRQILTDIARIDNRSAWGLQNSDKYRGYNTEDSWDAALITCYWR